MIAYYKLVTNQFEGGSGTGEKQLAAVSDLVIRDNGWLLKDRQGYVTLALNNIKKPAAPKIGSTWASVREPKVIWVYVGMGKYYRYGPGTDTISHEDFANHPDFVEVDPRNA